MKGILVFYGRGGWGRNAPPCSQEGSSHTVGQETNEMMVDLGVIKY